MHRDPGNDIDLAIVEGDERRFISFTREQRAKGLLICGVPGSGKTKLMEFMLRQDLRLWHTHHCGILLIDSQGAMYDEMVEYMAACRLDRVPVIPIDLRRDDYVVSFDVLRRRMDGDPAVHIRATIDSLLHAWGQRDALETPRLATWVEALLFALYEKERPLVDALQMISDPSVRLELTRKVEHVVAQATWKASRHLREERFQELVESTANRLRKFLSTKLVQAMLSQKGESLDMLKAINDGAIVLASLATAKSLVAPEDAKTIGNLLLSEAWQAVQARGATRRVKPFYVYADEAQSYVNPAMIDTLDQSRKFGLHFTFGMQFPSQFRRNGEVGQMIFDSLMGNCRSKVVFQQSHPEDAEMLALWIARQAIDPDQVKDEIYSPKVVGQEIIYLPSYGYGTTEGVGGGQTFSITEGENHAISNNWSHSDSLSIASTDTVGRGAGLGRVESNDWGQIRSESLTNSAHEDFTVGHSTADGLTAGFNDSRAVSRSEGEDENWSHGAIQSSGSSLEQGNNRSVSQSFRRPTADTDAEVDEYLDGKPGCDRGDAVKRQCGSKITLGEGRSDARTDSDSTATTTAAGGSRSRSNAYVATEGTSGSRQRVSTLSDSRTAGNAFAQAVGDATTASQSMAVSANINMNENHGVTEGISSSDTYGGSETNGTSVARTQADNNSWSQSRSVTLSHSPVVWQHLRWDVSSRTCRSVQEQVFLWTKYIDGQPDRHCLARLAGMPLPIPLVTATVKRVPTTERWVQRWVAGKLSALPFVLSGDESARRMAAQDHALHSQVHGPQSHREPGDYRRPLRRG
jgi:hypothetical protein